MSAIEVNNLKKNYGSTKALDGINFKLEKGEVLAFLGPNGAGKSTTMKILTCYLHQTSGEAKVNGVDVLENPLRVREMIGYLPESTPLYDDMLVYDFLKFAGKIHNLSKNNLEKRIEEMADVCGINDVMSKKIGELSKGYKQRVGLAYAILHDPEILILDEPTTGLDPNQIIEIRHLIKELGKKKSVILSTHILSEAEATAERAVIIDNGRIIADGTVDSIRKEHQKNITLILIIENNNDANTIVDKLKSINDVSDVNITEKTEKFIGFKISANIGSNTRTDIYNLCKNENLIINEFKEQELTLEDIFRHLTKGEEI